MVTDGEQSRTRKLLEILTEANTNIRGNVDPKLRQEEQTIQQKVLDDNTIQLEYAWRGE